MPLLQLALVGVSRLGCLVLSPAATVGVAPSDGSRAARNRTSVGVHGSPDRRVAQTELAGCGYPPCQASTRAPRGVGTPKNHFFSGRGGACRPVMTRLAGVEKTLSKGVQGALNVHPLPP